MAKDDPIYARSSGKKRKRPSPPLAEEGDAEAAGELESPQKNPLPGSVWKNLDLILSLQDKGVPLDRKVELALGFVTSGGCGDNQGREPVQFSRVVSFLAGWVQPLLISSDLDKRKSPVFFDACLDYRLWVVLKFCLEKSVVSVSQNLLRPVSRVLVHSERGDDSTSGEDSTRFYGAFFECLSVLFSSCGKTFNVAGVELWVSSAVPAVGLILKILSSGRCSICNQDVPLRLLLLLLEQFACFLRFHPSPKNIFRSFVDRLLEPLLELLVLLHMRPGDRNYKHAASLLGVVEDVLSNGLFHPVHISGFLSSRCSNAKSEVQASKSFIESYHRHFFGKLQKIITEKKVVAMGGFGLLFRLFVAVVREKRGVSAPLKTIKKLEKDHMGPEKENETIKHLFEVFIQFIEPSVIECKRFIKMDFSGAEGETRLIDTHCTLRTLNDVLESFMHEKLYERSQDSPEGAHCSFLKEVYDTVIAMSRKIYMLWLSIPNVHIAGSLNMLLMIAKELIISIGYFFEIEYKVVGDDLAGIWFMMLSYVAACLSTVGTTQGALLTHEILKVGCLMINMYSELRQVSRPIFALCEAVRFFRFSDDDGEIGRSTFFPFRYLSSDACRKAVMTLLCSQDLKSATLSAVKSIPEGQASGCIQLLKSDFTESLEWIRTCFMMTDGVHNPNLFLEAELFGSLSEMYSTVLESLIVTASNSTSIGNSLNDLMATIKLAFSSLLQNQSNSFDDFYISFTGRKLFDHTMTGARGPMDTFWIFMFFFRLYVSCRSLYLRVISLMPPDTSRKAALAVGILFTISSGKDWEERTDWTDGGYFALITKPSISLLVMIQFVSQTFLTKYVTACAPLVFVLQVMALQRLIDLNRQVKSFEYLLQRDARLAQMQELGHLAHKQSKKWKHLLKVARQEATDLTNFMTEYVTLFSSKGQLELFKVKNAGEGSETLSSSEDSWDMGVCSLNERSLPIAIWWLLCQNIDTWCVHASRRGLKKFSSLLVHHVVSCVRGCSGDITVQKGCEPPSLRKVTIHQISTDLLKNMAFYEQPILLRHFTSRLSCHLKKSILPAVSHAFGTQVDVGSLPDWTEVLIRLDESPSPTVAMGFMSNNNSGHAVPFDSAHLEDCTGRNLFPPMRLEVRMCQRVLILLCKLPMVHASLKSFSVIVAYILNLERLVVTMLLNCGGEFSYFHYDLLSLFISCRRTLRHLLVTSVEDNTENKKSSFLNILFGSSSSIQWFLHSASKVVGLPCAYFGDKDSSEVNKMFFILMDHTSCLFLAFSEGQMNSVIHFILNGGNLCVEHSMHDVATEKNTLSKVKLCSYSSGQLDAWKSLNIVAVSLKEETRILLSMLRGIRTLSQAAGVMAVKWNRLSNTLSCFQGFLWGLISAVGNIDGKCTNEHMSNSIFSCVSELYSCIALFEELVDCCLKLSLLDDHWTENSSMISSSDMLDDNKYLLAPECPVCMVGISRDESHCLMEKVGTSNCFMSDPDDGVLSHLRLSLLQSLLKGENLDVSFAIRQLFMSTAATLKLRHMLSFLKALNLHDDCNYLSGSTSILLTASDFMLSEITEFVSPSQHVDFVWVDGMLKYLEVLGSCFPMTNSVISEKMYSKMINMHLRGIGKCICLQGKAATLAFNETGSYSKMLQSEQGEGDNYMLSVDHKEKKLNEVKARLRMSFKELIRRPLRSDLVLVVQAVERALVGIRQGCNMIYEINTGEKDGGRVSAIVAAGIDCFDLVFESFAGRKLLGIIKNRIQNLLGSLINIILHLQSPFIFYRENLSCDKSNIDPDPGTTILMCVEMLTKVARKHSQLKMDSCKVGQSLHLPMSLFKHFHQLKTFRVSSSSLCVLDNAEGTYMKNMHHLIVDHQFCVNLYAACCSLLCTILRHRTSEAAHCIALLEDSVRVLLTCLESIDAGLVSQKCYFSLDMQEAVKCASFLRRVYEEVRQQKDIVGAYSSHFLSDYICVYSGYGPLRTGIKREVDDELRQGVYALIDMCSSEDFQNLHTVLGEGPCRRTLATLRHDYQLNFQYQGKI
uniref:Unhealthy ribosome biogenesis protein 2 n=1 Tax=Anthurium amnicola TaxID=1678845 RepID=A0A1D1YWY4_9ARAE